MNEELLISVNKLSEKIGIESTKYVIDNLVSKVSNKADIIESLVLQKVKKLYKVNEKDLSLSLDKDIVKARKIYCYCLNEHAQIQRKHIQILVKKSKKSIENYINDVRYLLSIPQTSLDYKFNEDFINNLKEIDNACKNYILINEL